MVFGLTIHLSVCPLLWTLLVIDHLISSKFHIKITFIEPSSFCSCGHANFIIYLTITSRFNIWITFIKLSSMIEDSFTLVNVYVGLPEFRCIARNS